VVVLGLSQAGSSHLYTADTSLYSSRLLMSCWECSIAAAAAAALVSSHIAGAAAAAVAVAAREEAQPAKRGALPLLETVRGTARGWHISASKLEYGSLLCF
jgi:hypothetical protein